MGDGAGDHVKGKMDEVAGKAKQVAGSVTGNERLHAEGHADEAKGKGEGFVGKVKDMVGDAVDTVKGVADKATNGGNGHTHVHDDGTTHKH